MVDVITDFSDARWTPASLKAQQEAAQLAKRREMMELSRMKVLAVDVARNLDRSCIIGLDCNTERIAVRGCEVFVRKDYNSLIDRLEVIREKIPDAELVYDMS